MAVAQGSKPVKKASAPKKSKASSPSHPPYIQMITDALFALKERTGSSHYAIAKHIEQEQKVRDLPPNFKKLLFIQLKKFVASGKLVKVKNSFKLPPASGKSTPAAAPSAEKPKPKPKAKEAATAKKAVVKPKAKPATTATKKKEAAKPKAVSVKPRAQAKVTAVKPKAKKEKAEKVKPKSPAKKAAPAKAKRPRTIKSPAKKAPAAKKARK